MLFCINYIHGGLIAGFGAFLIWCLPGAIGMYGLSLGVSRIDDTLPQPVYALLSGLNAATVGIIALAAVQLAQKAITDKLSRALVFFTGVAGMLYTALWYFPVLMAGAGIVTVIWDYRWLQHIYKQVRNKRQSSAQSIREGMESQPRSHQEMPDDVGAPYAELDRNEGSMHLRRLPLTEDRTASTECDAALNSIEASGTSSAPQSSNRIVPPNLQLNVISWKAGLGVLGTFLISFIVTMVIRGQLQNPPRGVSLFANFYLAGTIIFGGGPVVIPLLREYIVAEGWVSPRDFLLGLAIVQSFPGPNFNFAVYLGSLATVGTSLPSAVGALIGLIGIFTPGILISIGLMGIWSNLRTYRWLLSVLRGVNAGAVGLVFTAVYKLWQIGYVDVNSQSGSPLGSDPWWVTITATSFVGGAWFGLSAPFAILLGGVMGMVWYGVVKV